MIYLLHGEDTEKARTKAHELVDSLRAKKPDASFFKIEAAQFSAEKLDELINSQGLFESKYIVLLDRVFENKEAKEQLIGSRKELAESPHIFILLEGKVDKAALTKLEKVAAKAQVFEVGGAGGSSGGFGGGAGGKGRQFAVGETGGQFSISEFNIFSLGDAFGRRDKKELWFLFSKAALRNIPAEEIPGILFWAWKSMALAAASKDAAEAGINPYVFQKSSGFAKNFSANELATMGARLVRMSHDAHRGKTDFDIELERFVLGV